MFYHAAGCTHSYQRTVNRPNTTTPSHGVSSLAFRSTGAAAAASHKLWNKAMSVVTSSTADRIWYKMSSNYKLGTCSARLLSDSMKKITEKLFSVGITFTTIFWISYSAQNSKLYVYRVCCQHGARVYKKNNNN